MTQDEINWRHVKRKGRQTNRARHQNRPSAKTKKSESVGPAWVARAQGKVGGSADIAKK